MKKFIVGLMTLVSLTAFAQVEIKSQIIAKNGQGFVAVFNNAEVDSFNSYNWSSKSINIPLKPLKGVAEAVLNVSYEYNGIKDTEEGILVGDVRFFLSKLIAKESSDIKVSVIELGSKLTTMESLNIRQFVVQVKLINKSNQIDLLIPVAIDSKGHLSL